MLNLVIIIYSATRYVFVMVHTRGRIEEHTDEDVTQINIFNDSKQGRARQGKVDTDRNTEE